MRIGAEGPGCAQITARQIVVLDCPPAVAESSPGANPGRAVASIWNVFAVPGARSPSRADCSIQWTVTPIAGWLPALTTVPFTVTRCPGATTTAPAGRHVLQHELRPDPQGVRTAIDEVPAGMKLDRSRESVRHEAA